MPRQPLRLLLLAVTLAAALPAATATENALVINCADAQTQADMNICAEQSRQSADQKLNRLYKQLMGTLSAEQQAGLRNAQRAWLKFRDLQCSYETAAYAGGSIEPLIHANCLAELTRQRNDSLQRLLQNPN